MKPLSPAERDVLQALASGVVLKAVAYERGVSYNCIVTQLANARRKLLANSTANAVAIAIKHGWVRV